MKYQTILLAAAVGLSAAACAGRTPDGIVPRWTFRYGGRAVDSAELPAAKEGAPVRIDDELVVTTEVHRFGDAIEWVNWLENTGRKDSAVITNLDDAAFLVKLPAAPRHRPGTIATPGERAVVTMRGCDVGYGITYSMDDRLSAEEFSPRIHYLRPDWGHDRLVVANRGGVSSNEMMPFFDVQGAGQGAIVAIGWTGDWRAEFTNRTEGVEVRTGLAHAGFRLRPGERVRTSSVVVQPYGPGEDGPNKFRRLVRERYSHAATSGGRSDACVLSVSAWGGATSEAMKRRIEAVRCAGLGLEYLWIDAGWYGRSAGDMSDGSVCDWGEFIGDWTPNTRLHPQGLADVRAAAEAAGLGMMLWFDLERVSAKSRLFATKPSWMGLAPGEGYGLVNLGDPEGWRFAVDTVDGYVRRLNLRCYRQDFNMWPAATFAHLDATKEGPERTGITEIKHIMGLYRFWDELRSRHPGLVIDNCSSGGRRLDIETMRRSVPCFRTDYLCNANSNPEVSQAHNAGISRYLPYNGCVSTVIDTYGVRSTWSSSWGVSLAVESPSADLVLLKRLCEQYRRIRGYLPMDFHNHGSATADPTAWAVWQYHDPKLKEGAVLAFRRSASPSDRCVISLKGVSGLVEVEDLDTGRRTTCDASAFEVVLPQRRSSSVFIYRAARH